jgi:hypothetical protein
MSYLLDTNVLSELRKKHRCGPEVAAWIASVEADELFLSVLSRGEVRRGIELLRKRDPASAGSLDKWLAGLETQYAKGAAGSAAGKQMDGFIDGNPVQKSRNGPRGSAASIRLLQSAKAAWSSASFWGCSFDRSFCSPTSSARLNRPPPRWLSTHFQ